MSKRFRQRGSGGKRGRKKENDDRKERRGEKSRSGGIMISQPYSQEVVSLRGVII